MLEKIPSPFDITKVGDQNEIKDMYPEYLHFSEDAKNKEHMSFWFQENVHHPKPLKPFETIVPEAIKLGIGHVNTRLFVHPLANGIEQRILNGYIYFSAVEKEESTENSEEQKIYNKRTEYYYENWDRFYNNWKEKVNTLIKETKNIQFKPLPPIEDEEKILAASGHSSALDILENYDKVLMSFFRIWQFHFEMLNIGYAALFDFYNFCREAFPGIGDSSISKMLSKGNLLIFQPQREIKKLAKLLCDLNLSEEFTNSASLTDFIEKIINKESGKKWLKAFEKAREEWFDYSTGSGLYSDDIAWNDSYIVLHDLLKSAHKYLSSNDSLNGIDPQKINEIIYGYKDLLESSPKKKLFIHYLNNAQLVTEYIEDHNLYVEHRYMSVFWRKIRQIGGLFKNSGYLENESDIFYFNRWEVGQLLYSLCSKWTTKADQNTLIPIANKVKIRKSIVQSFANRHPPLFLGKIPNKINDPLLITLFGITEKRIKQTITDYGDNKNHEIKGISAAPGKVTGKVFVVRQYSDFLDIPMGAIIACDCFLPSWAHFLENALAVISENGGVLSHAAITCREFGIPAIVNVTNMLEKLDNNQKVEVDGEKGIIRII